MVSIYVNEETQEKIDDCQKKVKESIGFKPDKVEVVNNALDEYMESLEDE